MKRLTRAVFVLVLVAIAATAQAQTDSSNATISGQVKDPQNANVAGATVTLYGRDRSFSLVTSTDSNGAYSFKHLAPGEYLVEAEASGFALATAQTVNLTRGQSATLDIALQLSGLRSSVVVTASDTPQTVDEVSKALTVVDTQEIEERNEFAIPESLRTVPGLRVQQLGGPGSFTSIKTRGLPSEDTAVLIDGIRFRDSASTQGDASGLLEDLIVTDVSRLEVLRGSGSSLYGSNAVGGVVNVVTDEGGGPVHGSVLGEGGNLGLFRTRAHVAGGVNNNRVVYSAGFSFLNVTRGIDNDDEARTTSGQGRILFRLTPTATLTGRIYTANSRLQLNNSPEGIGNLPPTGIIEAIPLSPAEQLRFEAGVPSDQLNIGNATFVPAANDPDNLRKANFFDGAVIFNQRPTESFGYTISYQGLATNRSSINGPLGVGFQPFGGTTRSDFDGRIHTINARVDVQAGQFNYITGGYEFEHESFTNPSFQVNPSDNSDVDVSQRSHALFVQDQLRLLDDRLQIAGAFRAQFFKLNEPRFTPAASAPYAGITFQSPPAAYTGDGSVAYTFRSSGTKLRGHVGNGYRAPSLFERFGTAFDSFFGYSIFGDPRLEPERTIAFDAGIDQTLANNRVRVSATYFYTQLRQVIIFDFSGLIDFTTDPFGRFGGYLNTNGGIARGAEVELRATPTRSLNLTAAYTFTKAQQRTPQVPGTIRSLVIPDHQFSLVATQRIGRRLLVNFDFSASSNYLGAIFDPVTFASRGYRFKGLAKADLGASYSLPLGDDKRQLRFFGYVDNLFDREYFESGFRTPGRTGRAGASFVF
ncbi:MAG TPA: TonB-dependent receptor [Pyrinomonadaceae bacterium]|nr:TonB-dependent receptor [Pyrinomonadaceae bacterium]